MPTGFDSSPGNEPLLGFSSASFRGRRKEVRRRLGGGALILPAAPVRHRSRDTEYRYRPDSELFYLTGCVDPGTVALLRDREEEGFVLFVSRRNPKDELWTGPRVGPDEASELFEADAVYPLEELEERLPGLLRASGTLYFRLGTDARVEALVREALRWARTRGQRKGEGPRALVDPGELLDPFRLVKGPEEIQRIREATDLTVAAFRETLAGIRPGMGEWEVEGMLESAFRRGGARGPAFPTIVGSGANGCVLHYVDNGDRIEDGSLILLDAGAEVTLYPGDVTRTFPSGGRFTQTQLEVYEVVLRAHGAALASVRPGSTVTEVHEAALDALIRGLLELGVLAGDPDDLLEEKAYEPHFPHNTSHWLGLDVHDVGDYRKEGAPRVLEPGMVLTIEPGLYFPPAADSSPGHLQGVGIRIEDDVLVTKEAAENLTEGLAVTPDALEALVGSAVGR